MANERIYLHELTRSRRVGVGIHPGGVGHGRPREEQGLGRVGTFATVAGRGRRPSGVTLWECADGWAGVASHLSSRRADEATNGRGVVYDRLLIPAHFSPSLAELQAGGISGECYYHEAVAVEPGGARRYLELVEAHRLSLAELFGWQLVGAYRTALVHDSEAVLVWAVPTWHDWARWEAAQESDPSVSIWRGHLHGLVRDWRNTLLVSSEPL